MASIEALAAGLGRCSARQVAQRTYVSSTVAAHALADPELLGIWGGTTTAERRGRCAGGVRRDLAANRQMSGRQPPDVRTAPPSQYHRCTGRDANRRPVTQALLRAEGFSMTNRSTYLFASPSFAEGAGRLFDFADNLTEYNCVATPEIADIVAIWQDWSAVGDDLREAIRRFVDDNPEALQHLRSQAGRENSPSR